MRDEVQLLAQEACRDALSSANARERLLAPTAVAPHLGENGLKPQERGALQTVFVGGLWALTRLHNANNSDGEMCRACGMDIDTDGHRLWTCAELMIMPMDWKMSQLKSLRGCCSTVLQCECLKPVPRRCLLETMVLLGKVTWMPTVLDTIPVLLS